MVPVKYAGWMLAILLKHSVRLSRAVQLNLSIYSQLSAAVNPSLTNDRLHHIFKLQIVANLSYCRENVLLWHLSLADMFQILES